MGSKKQKSTKQKKHKQITQLFPTDKRQPKAVRHADYLSLLSRTKNKKKRQQLVALADKDQIDAVSEIIENVLRGTLVLTEHQRKRLQRYKNCMRHMIRRSTPLQQKKQYLHTYSGGFLPFLLSTALPVLTQLVGGLFGKR